MSEHSPLLPCPFCGSKTIARHDTGACWLSCADCATEGPVSDSAAEAHGLWNRRVVIGAHAELVAALEMASKTIKAQVDPDDDLGGDWDEIRGALHVITSALAKVRP